jgi:AbrB family looped-hinge helix DNA binding protein
MSRWSRAHLATVSSKGQITIRKPLRDYLGVGTGDHVMLEVRHGALIVARQRRSITDETAGSLARVVRATKRKAPPSRDKRALSR